LDWGDRLVPETILPLLVFVNPKCLYDRILDIVHDFLTEVSSPVKEFNSATQDLYFCKNAKKEIGSRFGVDCGARVGHYDWDTGEIF